MAAYQGLKRLGGGQPKPPVRTPDSLFSDDTVEVVLGLSEGPIVGLESAADFLIGDTPLVDVGTGNPNIGNFELTIHKGTNPADDIVPRLGGYGVSQNVNVPLVTPGAWVTRQGTQSNIDFLEVRIAINRLLLVSDQGDFPATVQFNVEIKPVSASTWSTAYGSTQPAQVVDTVATKTFNPASGTAGKVLNPAYRETYIRTTAPTSAINVNAVWFDQSQANWPPKLWSGSAWVAPAGLSGTQPTGELFRWSWTEGATTRRAFYSPDGSTPTGFSQYDFLLSPPGVHSADAQSFVHNGSSWVDYMNWAAPPTSNGGLVSITGKATSSVIKELRLPVSRIAEPYQVRVSRVSAANTTSYFADLAFESFQELSATPFNFPNLAAAHLVVKASDQFSSLPEFSMIAKGRVVKIPSNYNPTSRTYSGLWDGTFVEAYTTNGAWIAYDLVMNDVYGMNAYQPIVLDKFATYEFGKHWDDVGFEYNEHITEPRPLSEAVNFICGLAGGRFVDQLDGYATILFDADAQPAVAQFGRENVADGIFLYSETEIGSRKNDFTVSFVNPEIGWREDRLRVFDQLEIDEHGRNPEEFIAAGCTNEPEAVRRGRLRLSTSLTEKEMVTFKTNRVGRYLKPYDVILISDEDEETGISGRIKAVLTSTTLLLRDQIFLEAGITYTIRFQVPTSSGYQLVSYTLAPGNGLTGVLTLTTPLAVTLPEKAHFTIEEAGTIGAPKAWRITSIDEVDGEPDSISISATEVNRLKWAFVKGEVTLRTVITTGPTSSYIPPVSNVRITPSTVNGQHDLLIEWDASPAAMLRFHRVYARINGGDLSNIYEGRLPRYRFENVTPATYLFSIVAVNIDGIESPPVSFEHQVQGSLRAVSPPTNLRLVDEPDIGVFASRSPLFAWDASPDPFLRDYLVEVIDSSTSLVIRAEEFSGVQWQYPYDLNTLDNGGFPRRTFRVRVSARDVTGAYSSATSLLVNNPQVPPPAGEELQASTYLFNLYVDVTPPTSASHRDWAGMVVHSSPTSGFTPSAATLIYEGPNTHARGVIGENENRYLRVGCYDSFRRDDLILSPEMVVTGNGLNPGTVSFEILSNDLASRIEQDPDGRLLAVQYFDAMVHGATNEDYIGVTKTELTTQITTETENRISVTTTLGARLDTAESNITTNASAITTETSARTTQYNALSARVGTTEADIITVNQAVANETSARTTQYNALSARVGTAEANISTNATAISDETSARTTQYNGLNSRVGTAETNISTNATAIATTNGTLQGQYMVKMELVNNTFYKIGGFGLVGVNGTDGGSTLDFAVAADQFSIVPPASSGQPQAKNPVFVVGTRGGVASVGIHGNMFLTGTVNAAALNVTQLSAITGNVGTLTSGIIRSAVTTNGTQPITVFDLDNGRLEIWDAT